MERLSAQWVRASARNPPISGGAKSDNVGQALCLPSLKGGISVSGAVVSPKQLSAEKKGCKGAKALDSYILTASLWNPRSPSSWNATDLPSGARLFLSCAAIRTVGSSLRRPTTNTLRAAARKSMEPSPR